MLKIQIQRQNPKIWPFLVGFKLGKKMLRMVADTDLFSYQISAKFDFEPLLKYLSHHPPCLSHYLSFSFFPFSLFFLFFSLLLIFFSQSLPIFLYLYLLISLCLISIFSFFTFIYLSTCFYIYPIRAHQYGSILSELILHMAGLEPAALKLTDHHANHCAIFFPM